MEDWSEPTRCWAYAFVSSHWVNGSTVNPHCSNCVAVAGEGKNGKNKQAGKCCNEHMKYVRKKACKSNCVVQKIMQLCLFRGKMIILSTIKPMVNIKF